MKEWLLTKSNIRKGKGLIIGLIILLIISSCLLNMVLVIFKDFNSSANKTAEKLNSEDAYITLKGEISEVTDSYINSIINEEVKDYEIIRTIGMQTDTPYNDGTTTPFVTIEKEEVAFNTNSKIGKTEIVEEDKNITENYMYLPYQYHTGGKYNIGDNYEIKVMDKTYNFKVKGFINNIVLGSYNCGNILVVVNENTYNEICQNSGNDIDIIVVKFDLEKNVDNTKFINTFASKISNEYPLVETAVTSIETVISLRTYIAIILGVSFLVVSLIVLIIVLLMISNDISNYIKENVKQIGAIKAIGYTGRDIKISFLIQFSLLSIIGSVIGIGLSYLVIPFITEMMVSQTGIPYDVSFNPFCAVITMAIIMLIVILTVLIFIKKIGKIEPIVALRSGIETHTFKKNRIKLEKSNLPLNLSLALKTMFTNMKQNIATFIITFFLVLSGVIALVMFQNFAVDLKLSLLTFEIFNGAITTDNDANKEVFNYIESLDGVYNTRLVTEVNFNVDDARLMTYITDDTSKLNNQEVCYKGRMPKYDNEIAVSGKFCKTYEYEIGDEIEIAVGNKKEKYLITGFIQTTNNNGQEALILKDGAEKIIGSDYAKLYYFDVEDGVDVEKTIDNVKKHFKERIVLTVNFEEVIKGSVATFAQIAKLMVIFVLTISGLVILFVLYLLIKTLINNKKKDYGILKAIGYTSKDIIIQNAISFMPAIILSVVISCIVSSLIVNPYLTLMMSMFGVMKAVFDIPIMFVIFMGIGFIVVSFIFAIILSLKIRKIEPYNLLIGE